MAESMENLVRKVVADIADDAAYMLAVDWINERYREYVRKCRPRHLMKVGELNVPAYVTAGTVTTTRGSPTVIGDATAQAAWSTTLEDWYFRCSGVWYLISDIDIPGTGVMTLNAGFGEDSVTAGTYYIVKRFHSLPTAVKTLGTMLHLRHRIPLENVHRDLLDRLYTERVYIGTPFQFWADQGVDASTGARRIEIYPPAKEYEIIGYSYWEDPSALDITSTIPLFVDPYVLKEGALINAYRYNMAKAANSGKADIAQFWSNEKARQESLWLGKMRSMAISEKGASDESIILQWTQSRSYGPNDIRSARDQVYSDWTSLT